MIKNIFVALVMCVAVVCADDKVAKYTQVIQPASRQLPTAHDGYPADMYGLPQQTGPYPMTYQASNEGIYPAANEEISADTQAHQPEQALENPAYDPNMYQNFVPQDSVQQYVNSYGGPYAPTGHAVGYPVPYGGGYGPGGFSLQTGLEGYLVPQIPPPPPPPGPGFLDIFRNPSPLSRTVVSMLTSSGSYLFSSIAVILFGGAVTTAICTFTPLCTITFAALPFLGLREGLTSKKIKESIASEITSDRVRRAAEFVRTTLEKYNQIEKESSKDANKDAKNDVSKSAAEFVRTTLDKYNQIEKNLNKDAKNDISPSGEAVKNAETNSKRRRRR